MISQSKIPISLSLISISNKIDGLFTRTMRSVLAVLSASPGCTIQYIIVCPVELDSGNAFILDSFCSGRPWIQVSLVIDQGKGIYAAMNKGIACALSCGSTHISFINAGDQLLPDYCILVKRAIDNRDKVLSGLIKVIDVAQDNKCESYEGGVMCWNVPHPATIYPLSIFSARCYHEYLRISADWHFHFSLRNQIGFMRCRDLVVAAFYTDGISNSLESSSILLKDELRQLSHEISQWNFSCFHPVRSFRLLKIAIISLFS